MAARKLVKELFAAIERSDHLTVSEKLKEDPSISHVEYKKVLPLSAAVHMGSSECVETLLTILKQEPQEALARSIASALRAVVHRNKLQLLPSLLAVARQTSINPYGEFGRTVDEAIGFGRPAKFIRALLEANAPHSLPLHAAADRGSPAVLRLLLKQNIADLDETDEWGRTPLDIARYRRDTEGPKVGQKLVDLLQNHKAGGQPANTPKEPRGSLLSPEESIRNIPDDLRRFLAQGHQLKYDASKAEPNRVGICSLDELEMGCVRLRPQTGEGCYEIPAISLSNSCEAYTPSYLLLWLPNEKIYGSWDADHWVLHSFKSATWTDIAKNPLPYINAQWESTSRISEKIRPISQYQLQPSLS